MISPAQQGLEDAVEAAVVRLGDWLCDNTNLVFEEQPEIDGIRADLSNAYDAYRIATGRKL